MPRLPRCWSAIRHSDEDLLNACKASRRAGGSDDFSVIVLMRQ